MGYFITYYRTEQCTLQCTVPVDVENANELGLLRAADREAVVDALDDPREELRVDALGERVASTLGLCSCSRSCSSRFCVTYDD